jgi:crotonobetainyl-CoA:carnitine CoA-transferase CaiB-like acyl-CoA transferase
MGLSVVDQMTGLALAYALLAGVTGARATEIGRDMDVSLFDIAMSNLAYPAIWYLNEGHEQQRMERSAHPVLTPCQLYKSADGWIYIMCNKEKFWPALCDALDRDDWIKDERFINFEGRALHRSLIQEMLDGELSQKSTAEWMVLFAGTVPASPLNSVSQALENPFVTDSNRIQEIDLPGYGTYKTLRSPVVSGDAVAPSNPAPRLGADTDEILSGIGYSAAKILKLRNNKTI